MRCNDAVAGSLISYIDLEKRLRPEQPLRVIRDLVNRADHGQMESSERERMLEKQTCRTSCVNSCERNMLQAGLAVHLGDGGMTARDCIAGGGRVKTPLLKVPVWIPGRQCRSDRRGKDEQRGRSGPLVN